MTRPQPADTVSFAHPHTAAGPRPEPCFERRPLDLASAWQRGLTPWPDATVSPRLRRSTSPRSPSPAQPSAASLSAAPLGHRRRPTPNGTGWPVVSPAATGPSTPATATTADFSSPRAPGPGMVAASSPRRPIWPPGRSRSPSPSGCWLIRARVPGRSVAVACPAPLRAPLPVRRRPPRMTPSSTRPTLSPSPRMLSRSGSTVLPATPPSAQPGGTAVHPNLQHPRIRCSPIPHPRIRCSPIPHPLTFRCPRRRPCRSLPRVRHRPMSPHLPPAHHLRTSPQLSTAHHLRTSPRFPMPPRRQPRPVNRPRPPRQSSRPRQPTARSICRAPIACRRAPVMRRSVRKPTPT